MPLQDAAALSAIRRLVADRAAAQGNVFRRRDLLNWGVGDSTLQVMLRRGWWMRLRHGIYVDTEAVHAASDRDRHALDLAAAVAAADEPTLAFGPSAALLHGLPLPYEAPPSVHLVRNARQDIRSLGRASRHRLDIPSVKVTSHDLSRCQHQVVDGIPTVDPTVAAVSAAVSVPFTRKVGLFDAVLWDGTVTIDDLRTQASEWAYLGSSRATLEALEHARRGAQTFLETLSRLALVRAGLPEPALQVPVHDERGLVGIVDMMWVDWRVIGEADGALKYSDRADLLSEKRREDRLRALGFTVVRWMWDDIVAEPDRVARQIRRASRRAA